VHEIAALAAVLEHLRRRAVLQAGTEDRRHAGVGGVARHPRTVDVVVAQADRRTVDQARPVRRQVFLAHLAGGIGVAWIERRVLGHRGRRQRAPAPRAARLETAGGQVVRIAGRWPDAAVSRAVVGALAIDHHGGGQHQAVDVVAAHGLEQHGGAGDVHVHVGGQVGDVHAEAHHGRLVTHRVDAVQRVVHRRRIAHVTDHQFPGHVVRPGGVYGRGEGVEATHLVTRCQQGLRDMGADESGGAGD